MKSVKIKDTSTPIVAVNCRLASLGMMRSVGPLGVPVYGVDEDRWAPGMLSRYCTRRYLLRFDEGKPDEFLKGLVHVGREIDSPAILIPTSDETALFVAQYSDDLSDYFIFPKNDPEIIRQLISKKEMYELAVKHGVPTAFTAFPNNINDVITYIRKASFPVMLKGIYGNRLERRTRKKMVIVRSPDELLENYKLMEDPDSPNLMLQEYIPGGDDQVYMFNGYFNSQAECLASFTGRKIRQCPVHLGCASLGESQSNEVVAKITIEFMQAIKYKGPLDIGYRWDARDGLYKVLDINPRLGQAFRLFVAENNMDVVKTLYIDLTDQRQYPIVPREGRRWLIEDFDIISSLHYYQEGALGLREWLQSFKGVEEGAWFNWKDPFPFIIMSLGMLKKSSLWLLKKLGILRSLYLKPPSIPLRGNSRRG